MKLSRFVQWIVLAVIWVLFFIVLLGSSIIALLTSWSLSPLWILALFVLAVVVSAGIFSSDKFEDINTQIVDKLSDLSDAEMLEVMQAMDEVKESIGISIELPLKNKKRKRDDIDKAIRNLSDTELLHLKDRLREGSVDEDKLITWLEDQREMTGD